MIKKNASRLILPVACLAAGLLLLSNLLLFRPIDLPRNRWIPIAILGGLGLGWWLYLAVKKIASQSSHWRATLAGLITFSALAMLLPGPHHLPAYPTTFTAVPLEIRGEGQIRNLFLDGRRLDWPSICTVSGTAERSGLDQLTLHAGGRLNCNLFAPHPAALLQLDLSDPNMAHTLTIQLGDHLFSSAALVALSREAQGLEIALPVTWKMLIPRLVEGFTYLLLAILVAGAIHCIPGTALRLPRWMYATLLLLLTGLVMLTNLTAYAFINNPESKDAGVFLYMGQAITRGLVPYQAVWDHKPPLVFYLNTLGLLLGNGSAWGVWALEVAVLVAAGALLYQLMERRYARWPALAAMLLWLAGLFLLFRTDETNVPEAWGMLVQSLLLVQMDRAGLAPRRGALISLGLLTGLAFLLKQVLIGVSLTFVLLLLAEAIRCRMYRRLVQQALWFVGAALVPLALSGLFFWQAGALSAYWDAAFLYNFAYMRTPFSQTATTLLPNLTGTLLPVAIVAYMGWLLGTARVLTRRAANLSLLTRLALVALPIEIGLSLLSGKNFSYYSIPRLYCIALLGAALLQETRLTSLVNSYCATLAVLLIYGLGNSFTLQPSRNTHILTIEYLIRQTRPDETVLVWGNDLAINFYSQRAAPTRFAYQYALVTPGYLDEDKASQFYRDLTTHPASLLIDTFDPNVPAYEQPNTPVSPLLTRSLNFLRSHYIYKETIGHWKVYEYSK